MLAEARPVAGRAHLFECPARQADIMGGLVGVQKRAALLRIGGPGDLVVHLRRSPVAMQTATANVAARQARMGAMGRVRGRSKMRSEEHTSELQSLMRISYAVFCLKKKKHTGSRQIN